MKDELVRVTDHDDMPTEDLVKVFDNVEYEIAQHQNNPYCPQDIKDQFRQQYNNQLKSRINVIIDKHYPECEK